MVPAELAPFNDLFIAFGTPLEFSASQYTTFLADLASATKSGPLNGRELEQALAVSQVTFKRSTASAFKLSSS